MGKPTLTQHPIPNINVTVNYIYREALIILIYINIYTVELKLIIKIIN